MTKLVKGKQNKEVLIEREPIDIESFKKMIRQMGLKVTKQRVHILEAMSEGRAHITAQELFEKLNKIHPEIGCLLYTSPSPRDRTRSRMPSSA